MNFMKYPTKNDISISNAVLKLAKLQNAERLELTAATGAVIVTSGRMTVKELLSTVQSLTGRAAELMTLLRLTCGDCTNCSEKCAYRDRSITELIRPAVVVPDWARQDAGLGRRCQAGLLCGRGHARAYRSGSGLCPRPLRRAARASVRPASEWLLPVRAGGCADGGRCHLR